MKHKIIVGSIIAALVSVGALGMNAVRAVDVITQDQIDSVKTHCAEIQSSLNELQRSDALLRHNRGGAYRTISEKLMVPLNQRIASSQLDGGKLVQLTARYNDTYNKDFYVAYKEYDTALVDTMRIDCKNQPSTFYDSLDETRVKRKKLYAASNKMIEIAQNYKKEFDLFKKNQLKELKDE